MSDVLGRGYELHPRLRSPAELATLKLLAPERPAVVEYGRMLVEATIRRVMSRPWEGSSSPRSSTPQQPITSQLLRGQRFDALPVCSTPRRFGTRRRSG
jgi:hypothetical protein